MPARLLNRAVAQTRFIVTVCLLRHGAVVAQRKQRRIRLVLLRGPCRPDPRFASAWSSPSALLARSCRRFMRQLSRWQGALRRDNKNVITSTP
ncbi:hypothetical protein LX36DRAFT_388663 [Colletotrichum falcatum]|nr:hypothetical protein LX36DRAFT_388663 [Colletotrichum falcatum]